MRFVEDGAINLLVEDDPRGGEQLPKVTHVDSAFFYFVEVDATLPQQFNAVMGIHVI